MNPFAQLIDRPVFQPRPQKQFAKDSHAERIRMALRAAPEDGMNHRELADASGVAAASIYAFLRHDLRRGQVLKVGRMYRWNAAHDIEELLISAKKLLEMHGHRVEKLQ